MAVSDWSATTLCTYADVIDEYSNADDLTNASLEDDAETQIESENSDSKDYIGRKLTAKLRNKIEELDLDADVDILDYIENADTFKDACIMRTMQSLHRKNIMHDDDFHDKRSRLYEERFKDEFQTALSLVRFDADADGDIDQTEASQSGMANRFFRV